MSYPQRFILRAAELVLKGKNRSFFEHKLHQNIRRTLGDGIKVRFEKIAGSYLVDFSEPVSPDIMKKLQNIFGIAYWAPVKESPLDLDQLTASLLADLPTSKIKSFAVRARRVNRLFPYSSQELNQILGKAIIDQKKWSVNLSEPELAIHVEVMRDRILYYWERFQGLRGLPVGTGGKVIALLSGGIDSPVAAYHMASRGCLPIYVHFHSAPFTSKASVEKAMEAVQQLETFHYDTRLYLVPLANIQREIVTKCSDHLRIILYRRFMMRLATKVAFNEGAQALVTGDSVGQVASQTLTNLRTISEATSLPILRPLVGTDKESIIRTARKIGTYDISIQPDQDCCSYLMPRKPATHAVIDETNAAEDLLDVDVLIAEVLPRIEKYRGSQVSFPFKRSKKESDQ